MLYGLYLSAQGAEVQGLRQAVVANNIANSGTTGFKRDFALFQAHQTHDRVFGPAGQPPDTVDEQTGGITLAGTPTDFSQGPLKSTGAPLDVALVGRGFLSVERGGETLLTRNGKLSLDADGRLITTDLGLPVLDQAGVPIVIPPEMVQLQVGANGMLSGVTGTGSVVPLVPLSITEPTDLQALIKEGNSLYRALGDVQPSPFTQVRQGFLEESGTNPMAETMDMIETNRAFEMNMNMIRLQDEMLGKLLQSANLG